MVNMRQSTQRRGPQKAELKKEEQKWGTRGFHIRAASSAKSPSKQVLQLLMLK